MKKSCIFAVGQFPPRFPLNSAPGRDGLFFYTMEYTKKPITVAQQIETLKQRGLIIDDECEATAI